MLMTLPLLSPQTIDYSGTFALRETFWLGSSNCVDKSSFFCQRDFGDDNQWVTEDGWNQQLHFMTQAAFDEDNQINNKELLWLYVPDYTRNGAFSHIKEIPCPNRTICWKESENCAGFTVSDKCEWRFNEMELIQYTPSECLEDESLGCRQLKAYARYQTRLANKLESKWDFLTIIFTCFVLTIVSIQF